MGHPTFYVLDMKFIVTEFPAGARVFPASPIRIILLAAVVVAIYGGGITAAVWAGYETVEAAHSGGGIPVFAWCCAFFLIISGMLSVVYAFFFRPRDARLTDKEVAVFWWHGNGIGMRRDQVESVEVSGSKIKLRGGGETVVIPPIFSNGKALAEELKRWTAKQV